MVKENTVDKLALICSKSCLPVSHTLFQDACLSIFDDFKRILEGEKLMTFEAMSFVDFA